MRKIAAFTLIVSFLALTLSGCLKKQEPKYIYVPEAWGVFDDSQIFNEASRNYQNANPHVQGIKYKKFSIEEYEQELLDSLAAGTGPDIFLIRNTWLPSFKDKIVPAPEEIFSLRTFRDSFVDTAVQDFTSESKVYAAPMSVDSLALFYNKDLFNEAGITAPPATWLEFNEYVKKLTKIDSFGNIVQAGAAIGTAYNINRSPDIASLLMLQNGAKMVDDQKQSAQFEKSIPTGDGTTIVNPGMNALEFYTQFANSGSSVYTWNPTLHYSLDSFYEGKLAMMFNYSWHVETIKSKAPRLNFGIAPVPQLDSSGKVTLSNYWGWAVAKNKRTASEGMPAGQPPLPDEIRLKETWNLIKYLTLGVYENQKLEPDPAAEYLKNTGRPAARYDIIEAQKNDPYIGVFAEQNLISRNWYQVDPEAIERIFAEVINDINLGTLTPKDAIEVASRRVTTLMRK